MMQNDESVIHKIKRILDSFLLLPDEKRNWIIPAVLRAASVIQKNNIEVIFTTAPPFSSHLIGLLLKNMFNVKWIVDFRDPWIKPFNKILYPTCKASVAIESLLENAVIRYSDLVVTTTPLLNKEYKKIFKNEKQDKFLFLTNGYDTDLYNHINVKREKTFTISYTGTLYYGRSPEPVLKALKLIKNENKKRKLKLRLIGNCEFTNGVKTIDLIKKYGLENEVTIEKPVNYKKSIEILKKSHLGLVLAPNQKYQIPAKIYDSIGAKTKVLAITGEGATKDLVNEYSIGKCFDSEDVIGIKTFIINEMEKQTSTNTREYDFGLFEQKNISENLSDKIQKILLV